MATELVDAINGLTKMLKKGEVQCEACGCMVPAAAVICTQCGAPLPPVMDEKLERKQLKKEQKEKERRLDFAFSDDPHFNQDLWLKFYGNCFRLGIALAGIFNGDTDIDVDQDEAGYLCRMSLLAAMSDGGTANRKSAAVYWDDQCAMATHVKEMKGYNTFASVLDNQQHERVAGLDPVMMGFVYGSDGTTGQSRLGPLHYGTLCGLYRIVESVQETALLMGSSVDDLFCERYPSKFRATEIPVWCRNKASSLFASSAFLAWDKSPVWFNNSILENRKIMKKFLKDYRYMVELYLLGEDILRFNKGSSVVKGMVKAQIAFGIYCYDTMCGLVGLENTVNTEKQISQCRAWMIDNIRMDDIIVRP